MNDYTVRRPRTVENRKEEVKNSIWDRDRSYRRPRTLQYKREEYTNNTIYDIVETSKKENSAIVIDDKVDGAVHLTSYEIATLHY